MVLRLTDEVVEALFVTYDLWGRGGSIRGPWGSQIFTKTQKCLRATLEKVRSHFHKSYVTNNASTTSSVNLRTKIP